jgi:hypothetical protein
LGRTKGKPPGGKTVPLGNSKAIPALHEEEGIMGEIG